MKRNEILDEHKKGVKAVIYNKKPKSAEPPKPRNPVAKNAGAAIGGGASGAHKDAKKASQAVRGQKHKNAEMAEGSYRRSSYYNPMDYERDQQRQMDWEKRDFKRREMEHELGHEDDPDFERKLKQQQMDRDRGPWYLKVNGKILKVKGEPKVFDWKKGANNYALAVLKNKPELQGKIFLTKKNQDDVSETGEPIGKVTKVDPATKKVTVTKPDNTTMEVDPTDLKSTPDGKVQMAQPQLKPGTDVVSTEDMMAPPNDSQSAISGAQDHDEISKLLVKRLRRLAGL